MNKDDSRFINCGFNHRVRRNIRIIGSQRDCAIGCGFDTDSSQHRQRWAGGDRPSNPRYGIGEDVVLNAKLHSSSFFSTYITSPTLREMLPGEDAELDKHEEKFLTF